MTPLQSILGTARIVAAFLLAAVAAPLLMLLGGRRTRPYSTRMRYGFVEVRVCGEGIDVVHRTDAYYWHAGWLNLNTSGWIIQYGRDMDDPRGYRWTEPEPWGGVYLRTEQPLRAGATFRTDSADLRTRLDGRAAIAAPSPYRARAEPGVLHVDEASRDCVRGRFHLTLNRSLQAEPGPPVEVEGRFEIRRKPPPPLPPG